MRTARRSGALLKNVLICGARGFIGAHTVSAFVRAGWRVLGAGRPSDRASGWYPRGVPFIEGDFSDARFVGELLSHALPTRLVFLAGPSSVSKSYADPVLDFANQTIPLLRVLDGVRRMQRIPGVLLVSSAAVYGQPLHLPISETVSPAPISPYGFHKLQQELLVREFSKVFDVPSVISRVFSTFGEGLNHLAVYDITKRAMRGDYSLQGEGKESRDYLYVRDVARAIESISSNSVFNCGTVNIGSGIEYPISKVAATIYRALGISDEPKFAGIESTGNPTSWCADVSVLRSHAFSPLTTFETAIGQTVDWIRTHG